MLETLRPCPRHILYFVSCMLLPPNYMCSYTASVYDMYVLIVYTGDYSGSSCLSSSNSGSYPRLHLPVTSSQIMRAPGVISGALATLFCKCSLDPTNLKTSKMLVELIHNIIPSNVSFPHHHIHVYTSCLRIQVLCKLFAWLVSLVQG